MILLACPIVFGQEGSKLLEGRVFSSNNDLSNVLVVNITSQKSTITDSLGLFSIEVELLDSVRIMSVQFVTKEIMVTKEIFEASSVVINLVENVIDLDEVTVTPYNLSGNIGFDLDRLNVEPGVSSSTVGLPNADLQKLSQNQRLLLEADRGKYVYYYGTAIVINTHKIMNKLSGRTKAFEERIDRDKKIALERRIVTKFSREIIAQSFGISQSDIDGFLTYCMSQDDFLELSKSKNNGEIWEYLKAKSNEFKEAIDLGENP